MADARKLISDIVAVAEAVVPMIGGPGGAAAVAAGKAVIGLIDRTTGIIGATPNELAQSRAALERRVNDHLDSTISTLEG